MVLASDSVHTILRWIIFGLSIVAFVCATVVVSHCSFIQGKIAIPGLDYDDDDDLFSIDGSLDVGLGLFSLSVEGLFDSCVSYGGAFDIILDTPFKTARAFGVLSAIATGLAMVLVICIQLWIRGENLKAKLWFAVGVLFCVALSCNTLTFIAFADDVCNDVDCGIGTAGGLAVANALFLVALFLLSCLVFPAEKPAMSCNCAGDEEAAQPTVGAKAREIKEEKHPIGGSTKVTVVQKCRRNKGYDQGSHTRR